MIQTTKPMRRRYHPELTDAQFEAEIQHSQAFINQQIQEVLLSQEKQIQEMTQAIGRLANEVGALRAEARKAAQ